MIRGDAAWLQALRVEQRLDFVVLLRDLGVLGLGFGVGAWGCLRFRFRMLGFAGQRFQKYLEFTGLLLMDKILHDPKDPKLWELWYIPYNG